MASLVSSPVEENPKKVPVTYAKIQSIVSKGFLRMSGKCKCKKCSQTGHFNDCCRPPKGAGGKKSDPKKTKVNTLSAETAAPESPESAEVDAPAAPAGGSPAAQAATLNLVKQVQEYRFNPDRYQDFDAGHSRWWAVEAVIRKALDSWAFPDIGAQVSLISPFFS